MLIKTGGNSNDDVNMNTPTETAVNAGKNEQDEVAYTKIEQLKDGLLRDCGRAVAAGTKAFRLQLGGYGGSNVFFNRNGKDYRYSLNDGVNGSMYLAYTPKTAIKEVFQNKIGLKESDLNNYFMGTIVVVKDVNILLVNELMSKSNVKLHDVTTATRIVTQLLAQKVHSVGFDGMSFLSNVTGEPCLVLWHDDPAGAGMATTRVQTSLSQFTHQGQEAADILFVELGIPVEE